MKTAFQWIVMYVLVAGFLAVPAAQGQKAPGTELTVPEGTEFKLQLRTPIDSKTAKVGDQIVGILVNPAYVGNEIAFPKGTRVEGYITAVKHARHRGKGGSITPVFKYLELADGTKIAILGLLSEIYKGKHLDQVQVDLEGDLQGRGASHLKQAAVVAGAAATGGIGGIGLGIATGIGGLFGAYFIPSGHEAVLETGSVIGMRLARSTVAPAPSKPPVTSETSPQAHPNG
ncbi:MAG TPA: hypothetical protein VMW54_06715 [Terriglobia bacterium]|nr:hypothetical protein [Terriglobia bacterium]